jgi:hypothetical protein
MTYPVVRMELRTTFNISESGRKISYNDPVMFIGSCFATSIGRKLELGRMPVLINPAGTVYNPVSVCNTLNVITGRNKYDSDNLYNHEGLWISFDHYTDFSSVSCEDILSRINRSSEEAFGFLSRSRFLFITFGTARVFRWIRSGKIVSNCHKIPASEFTHELLTVSEIGDLWSDQLDRLKSLFPDLQVIFTISPVRHWKDGAHGNQVSKSVLFLAVERLLEHPSRPAYFPAYELVMDDLRDYRFYDDDMLHLSILAVDYIWDAFCKCYFDNRTINLWQEVVKISKAVSHRIQTDSRENVRIFAENIISRIEVIKGKYPQIDLENEKKYFLDHLREEGTEGI